MTFIQSLILGLTQAVSEFLPISSDGHLNLVQHFFRLTPSLALDVFLHTATFLSVLFYFRHQTKYFFDHLKYIIVGSIPAAVTGVFFKDELESLFANPKLLPYFFLLTGLMVFSTKFIKPGHKKITYPMAFIIGMFQALAILPGVSRSGGTIFSALILGLAPTTAFNFSFGLFIPVSIGAILLSLKDIFSANLVTPINLLVFVITGVVGIFVLSCLQKLVIKNKFWIFGLYVVILSVCLFFFL
jgi:undecaprenyl-diphosphatase